VKVSIHRELYDGLERANPERLAFTRRAFEFLPRLDHPRILDVGCGTGDVAIELARLGGGEVFGIDLDLRPLRIFEKRIREEGLGARVHAVHGSMLDMSFVPESFDVVWAEASLHIVGINEGLEVLSRFIRPKGYLVVHEMVWIRPDPPTEALDSCKSHYPSIRSIDEFIEQIISYNYESIAHFALPDDFWGCNYYQPLGKRIELLREKYSDNTDALAILDRAQSEVDLYNRYSQWVGSVFFIMKRNN
jgi:ubiquinone/menaquinone biosynthesis C-methylase UbiE